MSIGENIRKIREDKGTNSALKGGQNEQTENFQKY